MKREIINELGMELERWTHKSCTAEFGVGDDWATCYGIRSREKGKGHATELLTEAKKFYEGLGKKFGGTVALNEAMRRVYQKVGVTEYV